MPPADQPGGQVAGVPLGPAAGRVGVQDHQGDVHARTLPHAGPEILTPAGTAFASRPAMAITDTQLARGLGWATIGIAATEILATEQVEQLLGVDHHHALLKGFGLRELAAGLTLLSQTR